MRRIGGFFRRLFAILGTLVLLAVAAVAGLIWISLPRGDVHAAIPGLSAPVQIDLDTDGIPRVRAQNEADAAAALGFLHARERMFQMELMRRVASGELSELLGPDTLQTDRYFRTLGLRGRALADWELLPDDARAHLQAYANGVNAWIARRGRFAAPEFIALGTPRPWTPVDSLLWGKFMALYLSGNWRAERARLVLDAKLPPAEVDALWPPGTGAGHPEAALAPSPELTRLATKLAAVVPEFPARFTLPPTASNAWAVDGQHSASGAPLLAGDPHLGFGFPSVWYLARIEWPGAVRVGATAPGVPALVLGHNGHIAWSFTTTGADTQDLFIETPVGRGRYQTPSGPLPYTLREERIRVRGRPDETMVVRETRHGPVISDLIDPNGPVLALAAAELSAGDTAAAGLLALNRAQDVAEAGQAAAAISAPVQNLTVADRTNIALFVTGRIPIRRAGDGARAAPGADGRADWIGWASGDQLPHVVAPASGRLVNANDRIAPPDFPVFLGRDWYDDYRARRIRALLGENAKHAVGDFAAMQIDVADLCAQELLPKLRQTAAPEGPARTALGLLANWDGSAARDAPQPLIFNAWMLRLKALLLQRLGVPPEGMAAVAPWPQLLPTLLSPQGAHWCGGDCGPLLAQSLGAATDDLVRRFGPDPAAWRWGAAHEAVFAHPVLGAVPVLGPFTEGRIAIGGDDVTVDRGGVAAGNLAAVHGPEFRGAYDLADLDRSLFVVAPGQSGNPFSHLARNFLFRWRDGTSVTIGPQPAALAARIALDPRRPTDAPECCPARVGGVDLGIPVLEHAAGRSADRMSYKPPRRPQFFYTTAPLPCPYLAGRTERKVVTEITGPDADALHDRLSRAGFRRSHNIAYAPVCPSCNACVPIRIPAASFQPDRTLRRIARANAQVEGFEVPARATAEQFQLFQRYQQLRHGDGDMATMSFYDYRAMVEDTPIETFMVEFRDPDDRLVGACLTDRLSDGLSAVYSFFLPELDRRSLGTYTILWLVERARSLGLPYVYLGYWVPESRKMAYKARFRPAEVLTGGTWRMLTDAEANTEPAPGPYALLPEIAG